MKLWTSLAAGIVFLVLVVSGCAGSSDREGQLALEPEEPAEPTAEVAVTPEPVTPEPVTPEPVTPEPAATAVPAVEVEPIVFDNDFGQSVAPIFADKCASCHNPGGPGETHWRLERAADLVATHDWISTVVQTEYMPPWPASDLSLVFHDDRSLRDDEIQAIAAWSAAGAPLDVADTTPIVSRQIVALDSDIEIEPHESYQGSTAVTDDYRCFIYDPQLTEPKWLQGYEFVPDQTQIVHHAIGYLAPANTRDRAERMSERDDGAGWQCYGGSGVDGDDLFLGWAPGQLPTEFPTGSGILIEPGDFIIVQIHYHFDTDAPADTSTIRLDWADGVDLDPIGFGEYLGPAEIPCSSDESGPLCDRRTALLRAYELYGSDGVLADGINAVCGVTPADFAAMTTGIASSACQLGVRDFGEIVSVFGHEHEIGKSLRLTLNAGRSDEQVLLDIPEWSFDWQYNYYPVESIVLEPGDTILLECEWDRALRAPELEPAYVLWADGTNDEMCFATIATRPAGTDREQAPATEAEALQAFELALPEGLATCMRDGGFPLDQQPTRETVDEMVDVLFTCTDPTEIGQSLTTLIADNFGGLVGPEGLQCLSEGFSEPQTARDLLVFGLEDATAAERQPVGELVGDCVSVSDAIRQYGIPIPDARDECIDAAGRPLLVEATVNAELPDEQTLLNVLSECLTGD